MQLAHWYRLLILGYLGTLTVIISWYAWLSPSQTLPLALVLAVLGLPLLLPLPGILRGRRYTVAWSLFLALAYFAHALVEGFSTPADRPYAVLELCTTLLWFAGGIGFVRRHKALRHSG